MNLSYWEKKTWFSNIDFTIVGSGIVGLNCALSLSKKYPSSRIIILEKGFLPQGASTKNAGFACFGSLSEIIEDLKTHSEQELYELIKKRWDGLHFLRKNLGDDKINFQNYGGYELFTPHDEKLLETCLNQRQKINELLKPLFGKDTFLIKNNIQVFKNIHETLIYSPFEGQLDTGKMMHEILKKVQHAGVLILNSCELTSFVSQADSVKLYLHNNIEFTTKKLFIATNGFAGKLLDEDVQPARAQVLITKPIKNLKVKGTFHLDKGYYYFRNIDDRILLGGGRNLDFKTEETSRFGLTTLIQNKLENLLKQTILPDNPVEIEHRWSGIMGVGPQKKPIIKQIDDNIFCGVRMGGMGVAIGSLIGKDLADLSD